MMDMEHGSVTDAYDHTRIFLQPIAAAAILGLFAFAGAIFVAGAQYAGWIPAAASSRFVGPFLIMFGLAQFAASMWAYRARDGLATALHGIWGAFWLGFGLLNFGETLGGVGALAAAAGPALGYWFLVLAVLTAACALASLGTNAAMLTTTSTASVGAVLMAIGMFAGSAVTMAVAGYLFIGSALAAAYTGTAVLTEDTFGHAMLPVGEFHATREGEDISVGVGEPGVFHGQWRLHHGRMEAGHGGEERAAAEAH